MFLLANLNIKMILRIFFLILNNVNILFIKRKFTWKSYTIAKALPTTKQVEIINKKTFTKMALDKNIEAFVVYITSFSLNLILIYLAWEVYIVLLIIKKVKILIKYLDFLNVFLEKKALVLLKLTKLNQYAIKP